MGSGKGSGGGGAAGPETKEFAAKSAERKKKFVKNEKTRGDRTNSNAEN